MNLQEILKRFLRNAAMIVGSRITFGLLNLWTSALVVQAFGLSELGILVLLQAYVRLFTNIIKLHSWQAVLSFGTPLQQTGEKDELRSLLGFTLGVDLAGVILGIICAVLFVPVAASIFKWPPDVAAFAPFFTLSILFIIQGTPTGILRLTDRINVLAAQFAVNALIRFSCVLLAMLLDGNVFHLVLAWFAANIISGLLPMICAYRELLSQQLLPVFDVNWFVASNRFHRIWRFLLFSNLSNSLTFVHASGTVIITGIFLGPAAAATFQIAKQFSMAISRPSQILGPLISPEFAKLAATGDWHTFNSLIKRQLFITSAVLVILAGILFAVLGFIVDIVYGEELVKHLWLFQLFIFASILTMITFSFEPAVLAVKKPTMLLSLRSGATILYILTSLILFKDHGIYAFGYGFLVSQTAYVFVFSILGSRLLKKHMEASTV